MSKPARLKIINLNYVYTETGRLVRHFESDPKPWAVYGTNKIRKFRTHAKALRHACKLAKKRRKK